MPLLGAALFLILALLSFPWVHAGSRAPAADERERSVALFRKTLPVFRHPRCLNCHPSGDRPTQGMDMHPHRQLVQRGADGRGFVTLRCHACHGNSNYGEGALEVPGAPRWALAPRSMAWQGLSDRQLCEALKDPAKTHKTMEQMIHHNAHDELVAWGWKPGRGREPAPGTQEQFGRDFAAWVESGAHCP